MTTICLNMIVKDEAHCIARCLKSVKHLIDYYVIVDTGSADDTKGVIRQVLHDVPGEIHEQPWVDFGLNRTQAIRLAAGKSDYILVMDADDELLGDKPQLVGDAYQLPVYLPGGLVHVRPHIFKSSMPFKYIGVIHEYLACDEPFKTDYLPNLKYICHTDSARSGDRSPIAMRLKYARDAKVLEEALKKEPTNERYAFYLAQSYRDAGETLKAIAAFECRVAMGGWDQERWYSLLQVACLKRKAEFSTGEVINSFLRAFEERPQRLESMYELGDYLLQLGRYRLCYHLLKPCIYGTGSNDYLFVTTEVYTWALKDMFAVAALQVGDIKSYRQVSEELISNKYTPDADKIRIKAGLAEVMKSPISMFA